jgi:chromosome segregation ATPase
LVQSILFFLFGFLSAAFFAFAVAPAIWRRAVTLTRRRIEASMPLTLNEVQADKDQQRAEFAISIRKIEMKAKSLQERVTEQQSDVAVNRERAKLLTLERDGLADEISTLKAHAEDLSATIASSAEQVAKLEAVRADQEAQIESLEGEIVAREHAMSEMQIDADNRRIELVTRVTEKERLSGRMAELNESRKTLDFKLRVSTTELRAAQAEARADGKKATDLEKKLDRLVSQLSDRDDRLERREAELLRARQNLKTVSSEKASFEQQLNNLSRQIIQLEGQNAKLADRASKIATMAVPGAAEKAMKTMEVEKTRLVALVEKLMAEKDDLVQKLRLATNAGNSAIDGELRGQMHDLTAKIVALTAENEGPKSSITKILATANESNPVGSVSSLKTEAGTLPESLAERIKALQKSARGA